MLAELDRALRAELSITPSPGFEARVRQRIDDRAAAPRWRWPSHAWGPAAAALSVVAAAVMLITREPVSPANPATPPPVVAANAAAPARESAASTPAAQSPASPRVEAPAARAPQRTEAPAETSSGREPDVLVPAREIAALEQLVRAAAEGRVEMPAEPLQIPSGVPALLEFDPLVVAPIPIPSTEPGGTPTVMRGLQ